MQGIGNFLANRVVEKMTRLLLKNIFFVTIMIFFIGYYMQIDNSKAEKKITSVAHYNTLHKYKGFPYKVWILIDQFV